MKNLTDIIWLQTAFVGDVVLTSGAIALAAKNYPGIRQHLISTNAGCEVLKGSPFLVERVIFEKRDGLFDSFKEVKRRIRKAVRKPKNAVILQVHRSARSSLLCRYLGIRTITYDETVFGFLAAKRIKRDRTLHETQRVASLLKALEIKIPDNIKPTLEVLPLKTEVPWQRELGEFPGIKVAFAVGSQWGTKRWPLEHYHALARRLYSIPTLALVLIGSSEERALTDELETELRKKFPEKILWNIAGQTSFDDLRRVFPQLHLLVSNDSSPVHFASAFNIPTVAIFGPTVPSFGFGPLSEKNSVVEHQTLPCRPCSDHGPQKCPLKHFKCMKEIGAEEVFRYVSALLK